MGERTVTQETQDFKKVKVKATAELTKLLEQVEAGIEAAAAVSSVEPREITEDSPEYKRVLDNAAIALNTLGPIVTQIKNAISEIAHGKRKRLQHEETINPTSGKTPGTINVEGNDYKIAMSRKWAMAVEDVPEGKTATQVQAEIAEEAIKTGHLTDVIAFREIKTGIEKAKDQNENLAKLMETYGIRKVEKWSVGKPSEKKTERKT